MTPPAKKLKIGRYILVLIIIRMIYIGTKNISLTDKISIEPGENVSKIFNTLNTREKYRMKTYLFFHRDISFNKLEAGTYTFSGTYTPRELVQQILKGSEKDYLRLTILEGRSIYNIDEALTRKGYINAGEYVAYVTNAETIASLQQNYPFLEHGKLQIENGKLTTLEGFLYPDTYNVDKNKPLIPQLVSKQLQTFQSRVRNNLNTPTNFYQAMIFASIVEKEERDDENRPTVAGIFLKRIEIGMKLDADITLCYGLKTSYTLCTPAVIGRNVGDSHNAYNTRAVRGLPPTPICNPTQQSINAVLNPTNSEYLYYLHDMQGNIHYGRTLDEHNVNKAKYL